MSNRRKKQFQRNDPRPFQQNRSGSQIRHATTRRARPSDSSWDPVARWYAQWVGRDGSDYHRELVIPLCLELLEPRPEDRVVDIGCGTGILADYLPRDVNYIGVDLSPRLLQTARQLRGKGRTFLHGDAAKLQNVAGLHAQSADGVTFVLSLQDMAPLDAVLEGAAWVLKKGGRLVIVMFHPCFRVPRQSGWGWDDDRELQFRRIDSYLTPMEVPVRPIKHGSPGSIKAYHRPLAAYINGLHAAGFRLQHFHEVAAYPQIRRSGPKARSENRANREIPLLLGLCAVKED